MSTQIFDNKSGLSTPPVLLGLLAVNAGMVTYALWRIFYDTPLEQVMGFVQKIFYFHVPAAWNMFLAVLVAAIGAVGFLIKRSERWDNVADSAVDLSLLFGAMVLISGPLWGRKAWGAFWVWDVRLTSTLVLFLTLVACKIVRGYAGPSAKQISAGLTLFAVVNSLFVYFSVRIWRTNHPGNVMKKGALDPEMKSTLWFCVFTFLLLFVSFMWLRMRAARLSTGLDRLHGMATEAGIDD